VVPISVALESYTGDIDILVIVRGRKGKPTTLFSVKSANKATFSCHEVFGAPPDFPAPAPENCNCKFTASESTPSIMDQVGPCHTYETLYLGQYEFNNNNTEAAITAKGPFTGDAVIASTDSGAGFRFTAIHLDASIVDEYGNGAGCDQGELNSFIKFVLDGDSIIPATGNSSLLVDFQTLTAAEGLAVCHAIEFSRYPVRWRQLS